MCQFLFQSWYENLNLFFAKCFSSRNGLHAGFTTDKTEPKPQNLVQSFHLNTAGQ